MQSIDYATSESVKSRARRRRRFYLRIIAACVLFVVAIPITVVIAAFVIHEKFESNTGSVLIVGKTPQQVIAILGNPGDDYIHSRPDFARNLRTGDREMWYFGLAGGATGQSCHIVFRNGVAAFIYSYDHGSPDDH